CTAARARTPTSPTALNIGSWRDSRAMGFGLGISGGLIALMRMQRLFLLLGVFALFSPLMNASENSTASLVLGGGCFWCTEAAYEMLPGVTNVVSGYAGGREPNPTYEQVCAHATGHAEVIRIDFDPTKISLDRLLEYFWHVHNPTQVGGQ